MHLGYPKSNWNIYFKNIYIYMKKIKEHPHNITIFDNMMIHRMHNYHPFFFHNNMEANGSTGYSQEVI